MAIFVPSQGPASWQGLLADPEKHWRTGYSARTLAACWEMTQGLPREVEAILGSGTQVLIGLPEHKVDLPGGARPSQTDLFLLLRRQETTIACAVEGKVDEPFGPCLDEWLQVPSDGKTVRLAALCDLLGLHQPLPPQLRYQLLHRTASAVLEAMLFKTDEAAMIVHSFSPTAKWFDDFAFFVSLFGGEAVLGKPHRCSLPSGMPLLLGFAKGDERFLAL